MGVDPPQVLLEVTGLCEAFYIPRGTQETLEGSFLVEVNDLMGIQLVLPEELLPSVGAKVTGKSKVL